MKKLQFGQIGDLNQRTKLGCFGESAKMTLNFT